MKLKKSLSSYKMLGQAMIEYIILIAFISLIGLRVMKSINNYLGDTIGNFNSVLSDHLSVGVCSQNCFDSRFVNGKEPN